VRAFRAAHTAHARLCGRRGLKEVFGDVLAENKRMLDIARHLDFSAERLSEHLDVIRVTRRIGAA
jgi:hypothetical protein